MLPGSTRPFKALRPCPRACLGIALFLFALWASATGAEESEIRYLSGTGYGETVDWEFFCTAGRRSGEWTTIPVPSQWELQGFGTYNYGHDRKKSDEEGRYRHRFRVSAAWRQRTIDLVFEGVMTDAVVRLNGTPAGPVHQGAFYPFRYDVTKLIDFDGENLLEVDVRKQSSEKSVNQAERDADYWIFGGIFRPVYLEASPPESLDHVAIDARHDGALRARIRLRGVERPVAVDGRILGSDGEVVGAPFSVEILPGERTAELSTRIENPRSWSAETPHLYQIRLELRRGAEVLHRRVEPFGFRTVEVRRGDGIYVNGRRVLLKGVNRHAFWPDSGRTLNRELDRRDVRLIQAMNMNAVRLSHYPPDPSFLEACDELGLYVLGELAGWHDAYDTGVGSRLIRAMVERDVNHPSILFWNNGNEGGWNSALDRLFGDHDLQGREVLRPDALASGIHTKHYVVWDELRALLSDESWPFYKRWLYGEPPLVMPTELLHGLYDGGSGASLGEYWRQIRGARRGAGAFLWALVDEAVVRTDRERALDTDGNHAPDGVLGPYRELSGNYHAVRRIFSPVEIPTTELREDWDGRLPVRNLYDMSDLSSVRFRWSWHRLPRPTDPEPALFALASSGEIYGPAIPPGGDGLLEIPAPLGELTHALRLSAFDPRDREILTWVLPRQGRDHLARYFISAGSTGGKAPGVEAQATGDELVLRAPGAQVEGRLSLLSGELKALSRGAVRLELNGPRLTPDAPASPVRVRHWAEGEAHIVEVRHERGFDFVRYKLYPSGWLRLSYQFRMRGPRDYYGIAFPLDATRIHRLEWLGHGPARIWKNRREGGILGVWQKERPPEKEDRWAHEPLFGGFYGDVYWAKLLTSDGILTLVLGEGLDLGIPEARFPEDARDARAEAPRILSILNGISPIGTKFHPADELGPEGQPHTTDGLYRGTVYLRAGE